MRTPTESEIEILRPVQYEIIKEIIKGAHALNAHLGFLAALGSWGDTLTEAEVLELLQRENAHLS